MVKNCSKVTDQAQRSELPLRPAPCVLFSPRPLAATAALSREHTRQAYSVAFMHEYYVETSKLSEVVSVGYDQLLAKFFDLHDKFNRDKLSRMQPPPHPMPVEEIKEERMSVATTNTSSVTDKSHANKKKKTKKKKSTLSQSRRASIAKKAKTKKTKKVSSTLAASLRQDVAAAAALTLPQVKLEPFADTTVSGKASNVHASTGKVKQLIEMVEARLNATPKVMTTTTTTAAAITVAPVSNQKTFNRQLIFTQPKSNKVNILYSLFSLGFKYRQRNSIFSHFEAVLNASLFSIKEFSKLD